MADFTSERTSGFLLMKNSLDLCPHALGSSWEQTPFLHRPMTYHLEENRLPKAPLCKSQVEVIFRESPLPLGLKSEPGLPGKLFQDPEMPRRRPGHVKRALVSAGSRRNRPAHRGARAGEEMCTPPHVSPEARGKEEEWGL